MRGRLKREMGRWVIDLYHKQDWFRLTAHVGVCTNNKCLECFIASGKMF